MSSNYIPLVVHVAPFAASGKGSGHIVGKLRGVDGGERVDERPAETVLL